MADSLHSALRERVSGRSVLTWIALVTALYWFLGASPAQLGTTLATGGILALTDLLVAVYDLRSDVETLGLGVIVVTGGTAMFAFDGGPRSLSGLFLVAGTWLVLDAIQMLRHHGLYAPEEEDPDGQEVYQDYVTRQVDETLREGGLTRMELDERLDADEAAIDDALATLAERGLLTREGSELRTAPTRSAERGDGVSRVRATLGAVARRLARPVRLEFGRKPSDG